MSDKPVIFISHSSKDRQIALVVQEQLANVLGIDKGSIFVSTDPYAIPSGGDWFEVINRQLVMADALVVIASTSSVQSIWVGYEIGYFWRKTGGSNYIYPLLTEAIELRGPLERLQSKALNDETSLRSFFAQICLNLKLGDPNALNITPIIALAQDNAAEEIRQAVKLYLEEEYEPGSPIVYPQLARNLGYPRDTVEQYVRELAPGLRNDEERRRAAGTALYPPDSPSNPPGDPF